MLQDATDDVRKSVGIATPVNRIINNTVASLRCPDSQTSLEFVRMTMRQRTAAEFQLVFGNLQNSVGQLLMYKDTSTYRFQLENRNVVAIVPFRTRLAEWKTVARPRSELCMKLRSVTLA